MSRDAVLWHAKKMRREWLSSARDDVDAMTREIVDQLFAVATADLRTAVRWGPHGVEVANSDELSGADAAAISNVEIVELSREVTRDGKTYVERNVKVKLGRHSKVRAASELLRLFDRSRRSVHASRIVKLLAEAEDHSSLQQIVNGKDPVQVLIDRASDALEPTPERAESEP